jgi:hypothetical protein
MGKTWIGVLATAAAVAGVLALPVLASAGGIPDECKVTVDGALRPPLLVDELPDKSVKITCENLLLGSLETQPVVATELDRPEEPAKPRWKYRLVGQPLWAESSDAQVPLQPGRFDIQLSGRTPSTVATIGGEVRDRPKDGFKFLAVSGTALIQARVVSVEYRQAEQAVATLKADIQKQETVRRTVSDYLWALANQAQERLTAGKPREALGLATNGQEALRDWLKGQQGIALWALGAIVSGSVMAAAAVAVALWYFLHQLPKKRAEAAEEEP